MATVAELLRVAAGFHRAGALDDAERLYGRVLEAAPGLPQALRLAAVAARQNGRPGDAAALAARLAAAEPGAAESWILRGGAALEAGDVAVAAVAFRRLLALGPASETGWSSHATACEARGEKSDAVAALRMVRGLTPGDPAPHRRLASHRRELGQAAAAHASAACAVALDPADGLTHRELARLMEAADRPQAAAAAWRHAIAVTPESFALRFELARASLDRDDPAGAATACRRVLALAPGSADAHALHAVALRLLWRAGEAAEASRLALCLDPRNPSIHNEEATRRFMLEDFAGAERSYLWALALEPGEDTVRFNMAFPVWRRGDLAAAYALYDRGIGRTRCPVGDYAIPRWRGEPLAGRRIIVHAEQGIGDEMRFASCYGDLVAASGHCIIECEPRLASVLRRSFPGATIRPLDRARGETGPSDADFWVMAASLPRYFRPTYASFPRAPSFLVPDPARVARWRARLAGLPPGLRVGISWRSRKMPIRNFMFYTTLEMWRPVLAVPGVAFVNLQYDRAASEIRAVAEAQGITIHDWPGTDLMNDMEEALALSAAVDLGITTANTVNVQLGAAGTECWVLWPGVAGKWGARDDPYHPRHRLLTRRPTESVAVSLDKAAALLRERVGTHGPAA